MKGFYFTFNRRQFTVEGISLKDRWVSVFADNAAEALKIFNERFIGVFLDCESPRQIIYDDSNFEPNYYQGGEKLSYNVFGLCVRWGFPALKPNSSTNLILSTND